MVSDDYERGCVVARRGADNETITLQLHSVDQDGERVVAVWELTTTQAANVAADLLDMIAVDLSRMSLAPVVGRVR